MVDTPRIWKVGSIVLALLIGGGVVVFAGSCNLRSAKTSPPGNGDSLQQESKPAPAERRSMMGGTKSAMPVSPDALHGNRGADELTLSTQPTTSPAR